MPDTSPKPSITAIILSFNEEIHIGRCIERLWPIVERIVVIDSFSTDKSVEIARSMGAEVLQNPWKNHAAQFQWGMDHADINSDWTMRIDCDEYLEPRLLEQIGQIIPELPEGVVAYDFKLKVIFKGKFIRWGGYYTTHLTRLWRTGAGQMEQRWMDERIVLSPGARKVLTGGDLVDENLKDMTWWTNKHNEYATKQMLDYVNREYGFFEIDERIENETGNTGRWKRFIRNKIYSVMPLYVRSFIYFLQRYILRLGFLDGKWGFVWHFLQGFWYFVLIDVKIDEARLYIKKYGIDAFQKKMTAELKVENIKAAK